VDVAILIFDRFTALDAIGPYEVLQRLPGAEVKLVGAERGPVRTEQGMLALVADYTREEVTSADVLVVPGGIGTRPLVDDHPTLDWIRAIDATTTWTTSVCTGSLLLGAAGLICLVSSVIYWHGFGFSHFHYRTALRIILPSVTALILSCQTIFGSFFLSILGIRRTHQWVMPVSPAVEIVDSRPPADPSPVALPC